MDGQEYVNKNDDFRASFECGLERFEKDSAKRTRRKDQHHHEKCCIEISVANSFSLSTQMIHGYSMNETLKCNRSYNSSTRNLQQTDVCTVHERTSKGTIEHDISRKKKCHHVFIIPPSIHLNIPFSDEFET